MLLQPRGQSQPVHCVADSWDILCVDLGCPKLLSLGPKVSCDLFCFLRLVFLDGGPCSQIQVVAQLAAIAT